ncbi:hypothetical protein KSF_108370 [Reticulibacter mediterranei]|uniref:ParB-like N-terminal domain-containing protein n=1 Tax=Reticulibacter mediterranei TaxID=2778369 RepID=A0A8J3IZE2_9CHLR|nr:ParB/RepB/Spo0J family partition protein [Reticulibacter mediterranei]GHP00790.1 hypothetical protein KSF_108370 [Reticulibacter mediterranei]
MAKPVRTASYLQGKSGVGSRGGTLNLAATIVKDTESLSFDAVPLTPLEQIHSNPFQYRKNMSGAKFEELENSMRREGITSVILGRPHPEKPGHVQIVYGHRRIAITRKLHQEGIEGFSGYPILIRDDLTDEQMRKLPISENKDREDTSILDDAYAYKAMMEAKVFRTQEEAADYFGISRRTFGEILQLADDPPDIQNLIETKKDTRRAARDLRNVPEADIRAQVIQDLLADAITVSQVPAHIETLRQHKAQQSVIKENKQAEEGAQLEGAVGSGLEDISSKARRDDVSGSLAQTTQEKNKALHEQSKLGTWKNQGEKYAQRLQKRLQNGDPIPTEEIQQVKELSQLFHTLTRLLESKQPPTETL